MLSLYLPVMNAALAGGMLLCLCVALALCRQTRRHLARRAIEQQRQRERAELRLQQARLANARAEYALAAQRCLAAKQNAKRAISAQHARIDQMDAVCTPRMRLFVVGEH